MSETTIERAERLQSYVDADVQRQAWLARAAAFRVGERVKARGDGNPAGTDCRIVSVHATGVVVELRDPFVTSVQSIRWSALEAGRDLLPYSA